MTGPCSKTCGGGMQIKTRMCDNPRPSCGGGKCKGSSTHSINCNNICCPGKILFILIDFDQLLIEHYTVVWEICDSKNILWC